MNRFWTVLQKEHGFRHHFLTWTIAEVKVIRAFAKKAGRCCFDRDRNLIFFGLPKMVGQHGGSLKHGLFFWPTHGIGTRIYIYSSIAMNKKRQPCRWQGWKKPSTKAMFRRHMLPTKWQGNAFIFDLQDELGPTALSEVKTGSFKAGGCR